MNLTVSAVLVLLLAVVSRGVCPFTLRSRQRASSRVMEVAGVIYRQQSAGWRTRSINCASARHGGLLPSRRGARSINHIAATARPELLHGSSI
jgi:hypothetical protein